MLGIVGSGAHEYWVIQEHSDALIAFAAQEVADDTDRVAVVYAECPNRSVCSEDSLWVSADIAQPSLCGHLLLVFVCGNSVTAAIVTVANLVRVLRPVPLVSCRLAHSAGGSNAVLCSPVPMEFGQQLFYTASCAFHRRHFPSPFLAWVMLACVFLACVFLAWVMIVPRRSIGGKIV